MTTKIQEKVDTNPEVWTAGQVAEFLKISVKTVYVQARAKEIPCTIIGDTIFRFSREKIVNLV